MTNKEDSKAIHLLISLYDWQGNYDYHGKFLHPIRETIFEVQIRSMKDMVILTHRLGVSVKYKKPTDKNWYTPRAMTRRLFRKEINGDHPYLEQVDSFIIGLRKSKKEYQKSKRRNSAPASSPFDMPDF